MTHYPYSVCNIRYDYVHFMGNNRNVRVCICRHNERKRNAILSNNIYVICIDAMLQHEQSTFLKRNMSLCTMCQCLNHEVHEHDMIEFSKSLCFSFMRLGKFILKLPMEFPLIYFHSEFKRCGQPQLTVPFG